MPQFFTSTLGCLIAASLTVSPVDPVGVQGPRIEYELVPGQVAVGGWRWAELERAAHPDAKPSPAPAAWAASRKVWLQRSEEGLRIRATWMLESVEEGWWMGPVIGSIAGLRVEHLRLDGRDVGLTHSSEGIEVGFRMPARRSAKLELMAFVPAEALVGGVDGGIELWLLPAVRGEVALIGDPVEGHAPQLSADAQPRRMVDGEFWAAEGQLVLDWVPSREGVEGPERTLAVAQCATGLTFGDGEVRGEARISWLLRRGELGHVSIDVSELGPDLDVRGSNVHAWKREGQRIEIELKEPSEGRIDVDLRWSRTLPGGAESSLQAPRLAAGQVYRQESYLQVARDGELEVIPKLRGWEARAQAQVPDWAGGHVQGAVTSSFSRQGAERGSSFGLLRFRPLSAPPVVVDVAAYEVATTQEGRGLVQARYDVRNERASHLGLSLPQGARLLGVRVAGEAVAPARLSGAASGDWRVPLIRSLESVKGTLSFPVEVIFLVESDAWGKKESRALELPALDAPVAVSRVRVYLPPKYENRLELGNAHRVADFSQGDGISYGMGIAAAPAQLGRADELYREALAGWMDNDFRRTQASLDALEELGARNANTEGLQANLDLVQGGELAKADEDDSGGQAEVVSRRIRDQASVRAAEDRREFDRKAKEAQKLEMEGDYDKAELKLAEAKELGERLVHLEQAESQEQVVYNQSLSSSSARVADKKKRKVSRERVATRSGGRRSAEPVTITAVETEKNLPVGASTSRDFTAVVDITPTGSKDAAGVSLAGTTAAESTYTVEGAAASAPMPRARASRGSGLRFFGRSTSKKKRRRSADSPASVATASPAALPAKAVVADPNAALAGPVATASSVSVHIPAIGEAVLYQHMLLPAGESLSVQLQARRQKKSD
jgi:hypothetical protein